ncbi:MAG: RecX family transcriptional regulator [Flavobacteriaceae bacterium]|nr:RecX family transcriptional regulator [Flavobacteriaceae bacterium]
MQNKKLTFTVEEAKRKLEKYCIYQDRCHQEIERKLHEMCMIPEACELIILHLMAHDFLNEERFSKSFARGKFRIKKWGKQRVIRELKQRGISKYNIETALKEIGPNEYLIVLHDLVLKKWNSIDENHIYKKKKKIIDFLFRKGFEYHLIQEEVHQIMQEDKNQ